MTSNSNSDNSATSSVVQLQRSVDGRFAPGSGGRPRGSKNRISNEALQAVKSMKDRAIIELQKKLEDGNWDAIVFVLSRILPKDRTISIDDVSPVAIATALAEGEITPDEARSIASAISRLREIDQLDEMRARLDELETIVANARK